MLVYKFSRLFYFLFLLTVLFPITLRAHPITNSTGTLRPNSHGLATSRGGMTATQLCSTTLLFSTITPAGKGCAPSKNRSPMKGKNRRRSSSKTNPVVLEKRAGNKQGDGGYQRDRGTVSSGTRANQPSAGKSRGNGGGNGDAVAVSMPYFSGGEGIPASSIHSVDSPKKARSAGKGKKRKTDQNPELKKAKVPAVRPGAEKSVETTAALAESLQAMSLSGSAARFKRQSVSSAPVEVGQVNFEKAIRNSPVRKFIQVEDIILSAQSQGLPGLEGTYDGRGHKISNIRQGVGLFSTLDDSEVANLHLDDSFPFTSERPYVSGHIAGLLAGSSTGGRVSNITVTLAGVNVYSSAPDAANSGVLVGASTRTQYTDINLELGTAGKPEAQDQISGISGGIISRGNDNTFTNIVMAGMVVRGMPAGSILGSGTNNTISNFLINAGRDGTPAQLVGSGSYTLRNGIVYGDGPPYNLAGADIDGFLGYNDLSEPPVVQVGNIDETAWRVGPNLVPIPRTLDELLRITRSVFRVSYQFDCNVFACPPPILEECRYDNAESYTGAVQDFVSFDSDSIYILVKDSSNNENYLRQGLCNSGQSECTATGRLKGDGCPVDQLSELSRRGIIVYDSAENRDDGAVYMVWSRKGQEEGGTPVYLARYNRDGGLIGVQDGGYAHNFNGTDFSLQYGYGRNVLVARDKAWVSVGAGTVPIELPAHPSLESHVYSKAVIDADHDVYLLANLRTEEGILKSLIKYRATDGGGYDIDPNFLIQSFTPATASLSEPLSPGEGGIIIDSDNVWFVDRDQTGFHIRGIDRETGEYSGVNINHFVAEPAEYTLEIVGGEVQFAFVDGKNIKWYSYNKQGELLDANTIRVEDDVNVSSLKFAYTQADQEKVLHAGGSRVSNNKPHVSRLTADDFMPDTQTTTPVVTSGFTDNSTVPTEGPTTTGGPTETGEPTTTGEPVTDDLKVDGTTTDIPADHTTYYYAGGALAVDLVLFVSGVTVCGGITYMYIEKRKSGRARARAQAAGNNIGGNNHTPTVVLMEEGRRQDTEPDRVLQEGQGTDSEISPDLMMEERDEQIDEPEDRGLSGDLQDAEASLFIPTTPVGMEEGMAEGGEGSLGGSQGTEAPPSTLTRPVSMEEDMAEGGEGSLGGSQGTEAPPSTLTRPVSMEEDMAEGDERSPGDSQGTQGTVAPPPTPTEGAGMQVEEGENTIQAGKNVLLNILRDGKSPELELATGGIGMQAGESEHTMQENRELPPSQFGDNESLGSDLMEGETFL